MNPTAEIMKRYAIELGERLMTQQTNIINTLNHLDLLNNVTLALAEWQPDINIKQEEELIKNNKNIRITRMYQLLSALALGISSENPEFSHINIDLSNILVM